MDAANGVAGLMTLFPDETRFYINAWTWGYEEIYKAVARTFHSKVCIPAVRSHVRILTATNTGIVKDPRGPLQAWCILTPYRRPIPEVDHHQG